MSAGCCSGEALSSSLKCLRTHSCCQPASVLPNILERNIRWAPFTQVISIHRRRSALSHLPGFVFHQPPFHGPSDHIYHLTLSLGDVQARLRLFQMTGLASGPGPVPRLQELSVDLQVKIFSSISMFPRALCSAVLPSVLEMGRGGNSRSLLLESKCLVQGREMWRHVGGGGGHHGALSGELWAQKVGHLVQPRRPGSGLKGKNILHRGRSEPFAEAGKPLDWFYETGFPHHGRLQARRGCVTGRLCGGKALWTAEAHLCDIHPSPGLMQKGGDLHSQLYQGGAPGIANSQDTMPFSLSFSFKWTVEFPRNERGQTERRVDDEQIQVSTEMSFTKQI